MSEALIFVDTNIPLYAMGPTHPYKESCLLWLKAAAEGRRQAVTDVEVLQEILYRSWSRKELSFGFEIFEHVRILLPAVYPVTLVDIERAKSLLEDVPALSPRDAIHAAVMLNREIATILSFDRDFDRVKGLKRVEP